MFISIEKVIIKNNRFKKQALCICDECGKKHYKKTSKKNNKHHFCNIKCFQLSLKPGKSLFESRLKSFIEKNGVTHTELMRKSFKNKHGVLNPSNLKEVIEKRKNTNIKLHGGTSSFQLEDVKLNIQKSNLKKYGVRHYVQTEEFKSKSKKTNFLKYGVKHYTQSSEFKNNINWVVASKKRHETMKSSGIYEKKMSKPEKIIYEALCNEFGASNIEFQSFIKKWSIDFYILSIDVYLQVDGLYWHGLDRPLEEIKRFKNKRDKIIYRKYEIDVEQNKWFKDNKKKLHRVTDKQIKEILKKEGNITWQLILAKLEKDLINCRVKTKRSQTFGVQKREFQQILE